MSNNVHYSEEHCKAFVALLGVWRSSEPYKAVIDRDPTYYCFLLEKLIKTNENRQDRVGYWETRAAEKALKALNKQKSL